MTRPRRPSADQTRKNILEAAKSQFLQHGFNGASIKLIAQTANVNTNLIFHHFSNKETLWLKVKEFILAEQSNIPSLNLTSAKSYFKSLLEYRFYLFDHNPDLVKLIQWQQLTEDEVILVGSDISSPNNWLLPMKDFQIKKEIKPDIDVNQIMLFIIFSTHAPFMQKIIPFTAQQKLNYQNMIFDMCCKQFLIKSEE